MNREKLLVELPEVPAFISISDMVYEITRIMNYNYLEAKQLSGMFLEEDDRNAQYNRYFVLFSKLDEIQRMKEICLKLNNSYYLFMLNSRIEVKFPGYTKWSAMSTNVANEGVCDKEIMIRNTPYLTLEDILNKLPEYFKKSISHTQRIINMSQNRSSTFMRFRNSEYAQRAKRIFERDESIVTFSNTYTCLCREEYDDPAVPQRNVPMHDVLPESSIQHRLQIIAHNPGLTDDRQRAVRFNEVASNLPFSRSREGRNSIPNVQLPNSNQESLHVPNTASNSLSNIQIHNFHRSSNNQATSRLEMQNNNVNTQRASNVSFRVTDMGVIRTFNDMMTALSAQGIQMRLIQNELPHNNSNPNADPNVLLLNEPIDFDEEN